MTDKKKGLYRKYRVKRLYDRAHKHDSCNYFVLDWQHDPYVKPAIAAYIDACKKEYPELAASLNWKLVMGQ